MFVYVWSMCIYIDSVILIAFGFYTVMQVWPKHPQAAERQRFQSRQLTVWLASQLQMLKESIYQSFVHINIW